MGLPPEILTGIVAGSPYILLLAVVAGLITGKLVPQWVVTDLKEQVTEGKIIIKDAVKSYESINEQLRINNSQLEKNSIQYENIQASLRELLRDKK